MFPHDSHHGHSHHPVRPHMQMAAPGFSLLRLSAFERLGGALMLSLLIWLGVIWAVVAS